MIEAIGKLGEYDVLLKKLEEKLAEEENILKDLNDGKKNFFTFLKIKTQEEALKEKNDAVSSLQTDIKQIKTIRSIFFFILLEIDIFKFISTKSEIFKNSLKDYCNKTSEEYGQFLDQIKFIESTLDN